MQPATIRKKNPTAYAILAVITGPFSLLFINIWMALFILCVPVVFCTLVDFYLLNGNLNELGQFMPSFIVWAGAYWIMCVTLAYKGANWHNRMMANIRSSASKSKDSLPADMRRWLMENPEATVNDYYAIAGKQAMRSIDSYMQERSAPKVIYTLSMK